MVYSQLGNATGNALNFAGGVGNNSFLSGLSSLGTKGMSMFDGLNIGGGLSKGFDFLGSKQGQGLQNLAGLGLQYMDAKDARKDKMDQFNRMFDLETSQLARTNEMEDIDRRKAQTGFREIIV